MITQDKNHIPPPRKPRGFSHQSYRSLTGKRQRHSERITCRRRLQWLLNVWDNVPMDLKYACQQYFTYMCFLGFIRYNKTFIAYGFRKYENLFTHEYHIWCSWVNKFSYFPHQHVINAWNWPGPVNIMFSSGFCPNSFLALDMQQQKTCRLTDLQILSIIWQIVHGTSGQMPLNIILAWRVLYIWQNNYNFRPLGACVERTLSFTLYLLQMRKMNLLLV